MKLHSEHPSFFFFSPPSVPMNDCFRCNKSLHPGIERQILTKGIFSRSFHPSVERARVCVYTPRDIISPRGFKSRSSLRVTIIYKSYRTEEEIVTVLSNDSINREYFSLPREGSERDRRILRDRLESREKRMEGGKKEEQKEREGKRKEDKKRSEVEKGTKGSREKRRSSQKWTKKGRKEGGREG